jgi:hypothetical protein
LNRILLCVALLLPLAAVARVDRSAAEVLAFKRSNPCPSTGERRGSCPGHVVDHIMALCAGGPDRIGNMQWQTVADGKAKDRDERRLCRDLRRSHL